MTIHVEKIVPSSFPVAAHVAHIGHESVYKIELTAIELHYMMTVLKLFNRHAVGSTAENDFACKSARIMQDTMIANEDYM